MQKKDSGVAVVIGTIMLIAIAVSLMSTYLFWYIPYEGTFNEQNYYLQTQSAFSTLENKLNSNNIVPGAIVTQSIPIGISGEPPFTPETDSTVIFSNSTSNMFALSISYNVTVDNKVTGLKNYTFTNTYNSTGMVYSVAQLQYLISYGYAIENGLLFRDEGVQSGLLSGSHFSMQNLSGNFTLSAEFLNISGQGVSVGGYGAAIFQSEFSIIQNTTLNLGENSSLVNKGFVSGTIAGITVKSISYYVNGTFAKAFDLALINEFNYSAESNYTSWAFMHVMSVTLKGSSLLLHNTRIMKMKSLSLGYGSTDLLAL